MKPTTLTRSKKRKLTYERNRLFILKEGGLTENQYNNFWLDAGRDFLKQTFPRSPHYYNKYYNEKSYWKWWLKKWQDREMQLLQEIKEDKEAYLNVNVYANSMLPIIDSEPVVHNFIDYMENLQGVI